MTTKYRNERISKIIKNIKLTASGRTRYVGQAVFNDEELLAYIEQIEKLLDEKEKFIQSLRLDNVASYSI